METIAVFISDYGYLALFLLLFSGIIGLPIPDETLLTFAGFLVSQGTLNYFLTILASFIGSITGMTISYFIGYYFGITFLEKHGKKIFMPPERMKKVEKWFKKYGQFTVSIGYFIPGIRQVTAYSAGMSKWRFSGFIFYAIIGGLVWAVTFVSLGALLGQHWYIVTVAIKEYTKIALIVGIAIVALIAITWYIYKKYAKATQKPKQ